MELNKDTRDRIFSAADSLYEQAGRGSFPTVDAVRKASKVNMNAYSTETGHSFQSKLDSHSTPIWTVGA